MRGRRGLATSEVAWFRFRSQENEQVAEAADCESAGSRQWAGLAVCRAGREVVVAVGPSATAEQLAGSDCQRPGRAIHTIACDLPEVPRRSRCEYEQPVALVRCVSDPSPSDVGCKTAKDPAELICL